MRITQEELVLLQGEQGVDGSLTSNGKRMVRDLFEKYVPVGHYPQYNAIDLSSGEFSIGSFTVVEEYQ